MDVLSRRVETGARGWPEAEEDPPPHPQAGSEDGLEDEEVYARTPSSIGLPFFTGFFLDVKRFYQCFGLITIRIRIQLFMSIRIRIRIRIRIQVFS